MKLSVFPKSIALPKSAEEKASQARFVSKPYKPEVKEFTTEDDLIELVTNYAYSPFIFQEYRRESDFLSTDLVVFDIDEKMKIEEAEKIINELQLTCLCLPSTSHSEEHHKFRLIFPLSRTISDPDDFRATYAKLAENFPVDPQTKDLCRFYYGSRMTAGFWLEGSLLTPVHSKKPEKRDRKDYDQTERVTVGKSLEELVQALYDEPRERIPEGIAYFLENAPDNLQGEMFKASNSFLFSAALAGLEEDRIKTVFYSLYKYEVTNKVRYTVDKIIKEGYDEREEQEEL
jgi:hypothetical protein